jgi:RIO-like serine/threonine protein kinase
VSEHDSTDRRADRLAGTPRADPQAMAELPSRAAATVDRAGGADDAHERLERGTMFGRYFLLERLGAGGMGVVYAALDPELGRKVAIKLLRRGFSSGGRLLAEARALARLSHPNIVAVHDIGALAGRVFVAMELVDGETLRAWLATRPRREQVLAALVDAGRGLAAAHAAGLVHGDFKPKSVLPPSLPPPRPRNAADSTISGR